jgi:hypothetical protein
VICDGELRFFYFEQGPERMRLDLDCRRNHGAGELRIQFRSSLETIKTIYGSLSKEASKIVGGSFYKRMGFLLNSPFLNKRLSFCSSTSV